MTRADYDQATGPTGALLVGAPETVATKIVRMVKGLGLSRFDLKYSMGTMPHEKLMASIQLYATQVAPLVRAQL
jgi:alkanesulfonate monooxygenase SsuD/methylene tetrahydromethanopterin reductase-like flavin-dependent oxidoreductase (luciferase family)